MVAEMADTVQERPPAAGEETPAHQPAGNAWAMRAAVAAACALLGFVLVAQVRATEGFGERLEIEREEDLARILSDLTAESDRLQTEITDLRLLLIEYENSQESDELALRNLQRRLADMQILAGVVPAEGEGVQFTIEDPRGQVTQDLFVDVVQELRDAGAEAIAVNGVRLIASSSFTTRNNRVLADGQPLVPPYRFAAVGPPETMASALAIPGGAIDTLERTLTDVTTAVETLGQLVVPERSEPVPFVFGEPVPAGAAP
jgi:uncharacterized protein YlxW (UPF0749 family)